MDRVEEVYLNNQAKADEFTATHIAENSGPMHKCPRCGNMDPAFFRLDAKSGDTICIGSDRSEEHTSELQSLMRISYAVFCLKKKIYNNNENTIDHDE